MLVPSVLANIIYIYIYIFNTALFEEIYVLLLCQTKKIDSHYSDQVEHISVCREFGGHRGAGRVTGRDGRLLL